MPSNPDKRRCERPGCRAWAMRGQRLCASHTRAARRSARVEAANVPGLGQLQRALSGPIAEQRDEQVIARELQHLYEARAFFLAWVQAQRDASEDGEALNPAQFLRAWNDSAARVVQLLRARRELSAGAQGQFGPLMDSVFDELERSLRVSGAPEESG
jgi:hypothetical protein